MFLFNIIGSTEYNNGVSYALYSYEAQNSDELSFKSDDKLIILNKNEDEENGDDCDGWWTATTIDSKEGLVPNNYLGVSLFNLIDFNLIFLLIFFYLF